MTAYRNSDPNTFSPNPKTTRSFPSRSRRWICAAAWCGSAPRSTKSCRATIIRCRSQSCSGEAIALAALFGSALKFDGRFILQTKTDGPVRMLVVDYATGGNLRACARFDKKRGRGGDRGRRDFVRPVARPRPSRDDDRSGRRHEPLSGRRRARRREPGRGRARIFPPLGADPDLRAARGRRGIPRGRGRSQASLARGRDAAAISAEVGRAHARRRSASRRRAGRHRRAARSRTTTPGSRAAP